MWIGIMKLQDPFGLTTFICDPSSIPFLLSRTLIRNYLTIVSLTLLQVVVCIDGIAFGVPDSLKGPTTFTSQRAS